VIASTSGPPGARATTWRIMAGRDIGTSRQRCAAGCRALGL